MKLFRAASLGFTAAMLSGVFAFASPAKAYWDEHHRWHDHWERGWAPPAYYAPPPVYYAPPPAYYAPPPVVYAPAPVYYPPTVSLGVRIR